MKLYVVKLPDDRLIFGELNEAVVRAENPDRAKELLAKSWQGTQYDFAYLATTLQVAEINPNGPEGIVSGTVLE